MRLGWIELGSNVLKWQFKPEKMTKRIIDIEKGRTYFESSRNDDGIVEKISEIREEENRVRNKSWRDY